MKQWLKWIRWRMALWACRGRMRSLMVEMQTYTPGWNNALRDIRILEDLGIRRGWITPKDRTVFTESESEEMSR